MADAARGKKALEASRYEDAIEHYTAALKSSPMSPDYLIQRSAAYQRFKNHTAALADAERAVVYAQQRGKRELIVEAQFRRGCALHSLERYGDAQFVFDLVKKKDDKHKAVTMWLGLVKTAINKLDAEDEKRECHVKETPEVEESAPPDVATKSVSPSTASTTSTAATSSTAPTTATTPAAPVHTPAEKIRYEWYQNSTHVYFTLFAKGVPKDKAQIDIQERSLSISFPLANKSSFDFTVEPLFAAVNPEKCDPRIMSTKIEVVLAKATPGRKWSTLESKEPADAAALNSNGTTATDAAVKKAVLLNPTTTGPAYPTSSKSGPKDWDKVVKEANKAARSDSEKKSSGYDDDDDDEGADGANFFFNKLYKDSSPEVQRAMVKSFTESNGTALNTNWDEVSKGKVETVPPDGMEAREYEK